MHRPLPWRPLREKLLVLGPVSGDGLRVALIAGNDFVHPC